MILNNKLLTKYILVIIMLSITQFFGLAKAEKSYPYMPRQINLSGNIINFSMPENFSKDFPADDLIESYDLSKVKVGKPVELLRRWWDFSGNSFFKKNIGTMMMTIHVYESIDTTRDISNPLDFAGVIMSEMEVRFEDENKNRANSEIVHFPKDYYLSYIERVYNHQRWLRAGSGNENDSQAVFHYWKPLSEKQYILVEFHFAPNNRVPMRQFIDEYCRDMLEEIMSTFDVIYANENTLKAKLEANSHLKLEKLVDEIGQKQLQ